LKTEPKYYVIMDGWKCLTVISDERQCWPPEYCGGCDACMLMQAYHYGNTIRELKGFWKVYEWVAFQVTGFRLWVRELFHRRDEWF
jgi:hypothetical protein